MSGMRNPPHPGSIAQKPGGVADDGAKQLNPAEAVHLQRALDAEPSVPSQTPRCFVSQLGCGFRSRSPGYRRSRPLPSAKRGVPAFLVRRRSEQETQ